MIHPFRFYLASTATRRVWLGKHWATRREAQHYSKRYSACCVLSGREVKARPDVWQVLCVESIRQG